MAESTLFTFLFLATLPIGLMPAIISLFVRHPVRYAILAGNLTLWCAAYFSGRSFFDSQSGLFLPVPVVVLCWIGLLAYAIRSQRTPSASPADPADET